ncbi:MAG: hypothetical protein ACLQU2_21885 [Candidatus Binataceae bacterium]
MLLVETLLIIVAAALRTLLAVIVAGLISILGILALTVMIFRDGLQG